MNSSIIATFFSQSYLLCRNLQGKAWETFSGYKIIFFSPGSSALQRVLQLPIPTSSRPQAQEYLKTKRVTHSSMNKQTARSRWMLWDSQTIASLTAPLLLLSHKEGKWKERNEKNAEVKRVERSVSPLTPHHHHYRSRCPETGLHDLWCRPKHKKKKGKLLSKGKARKRGRKLRRRRNISLASRLCKGECRRFCNARLFSKFEDQAAICLCHWLHTNGKMPSACEDLWGLIRIFKTGILLMTAYFASSVKTKNLLSFFSHRLKKKDLRQLFRADAKLADKILLVETWANTCNRPHFLSQCSRRFQGTTPDDYRNFTASAIIVAIITAIFFILRPFLFCQVKLEKESYSGNSLSTGLGPVAQGDTTHQLVVSAQLYST